MKHYQLTSDAITGFVDFFFDDMGLLVKFDISNAQLSTEQQIFILKKLPRELAELQNVIGKSPSAKLTEIKFEVTFEAFWNKYEDKQMSSRKKALLKWNKMNDSDKLKAYNFISMYFTGLGNTRKKYAETYLNAELWNN
jgi:hypothetical protein